MMTLPQSSFPPQQTSSDAQQFQHQHHHHRRVPTNSQHHRQRALYSQWANQRELLEFQMSAVRSPDDEAHLTRLSQNIEELKRLSQEARLG
jgi:hypothetical protein